MVTKTYLIIRLGTGV